MRVRARVRVRARPRVRTRPRPRPRVRLYNMIITLALGGVTSSGTKLYSETPG